MYYLLQLQIKWPTVCHSLSDSILHEKLAEKHFYAKVSIDKIRQNSCESFSRDRINFSIFDYTLLDIHYLLYTIYCTTNSALPSLHYLLFTINCTKLTVNNKQYTTNSTLPNVHVYSLQYTTNKALPSVHYLLYTTNSAQLRR